MGLPWPTFALASAGGSFALVNFAPAYSLHQSYLQTFFVSFLTIALSAILYAIVLYPHFLSPLRHLPKPTVRTSIIQLRLLEAF